MSFFGELYLRTTAPFHSGQVTQREVQYLAEAFREAPPGHLLDVGCGQGRHAAALDTALRPARRVFGLELDEVSLAGRLADLVAVRADFRQLPLPQRALAGAYAWYSTLFVLEDDAAHLDLLRELRRVLVPNGRLVLQTVPYERLAASPRAQFEGPLPDGAFVTERSVFDTTTRTDAGERTLRLPDGRVLSGTYRIRYYPWPELRGLLEAAGFAVRWVHGDLDGGPLESTSHELIVGVEVRHG